MTNRKLTEIMESIYLTYFDEIKNYLEKNLFNESILEDATQEVFAEFFRLLSKEEISFEVTQDFHTKQFLYFLSDELCYHYKKSKMSIFFKSKQLKQINRQLEKELNERYRDILMLRYIKHYDANTIIDIMHLKNKGVYKTLLKVAKEQLSKLMILLLLLITLHTTTYAVRKIYLVIKENFNGNRKEIRYIVPDTLSSQSTDIIHYIPAYIPSGYVLTDRSYAANHNLMIYSNEKDTIVYTQMSVSSAVSIDNNFKLLETIKKKNTTYYFMSNESANLLMWTDSIYQYQLISKLKQKELLKIAESIQIEK